MLISSCAPVVLNCMSIAQNGSPEPGAAYISPAQRVLLNDDLLVTIFETSEYIEESAAICARASRVCRAWDRLASVYLWRSLPSPFPLFNVLRPVPPSPSVPRGNLWNYAAISSSAEKKDYFTEVCSNVLYTFFSAAGTLNISIAH